MSTGKTDIVHDARYHGVPWSAAATWTPSIVSTSAPAGRPHVAYDKLDRSSGAMRIG